MKKRKNNSGLLALLLFLLTSSFLFCQNTTTEYIIITYSVDRNKDSHSTKDYYWITPVSSLKENEELIKYPLYFDEFSNDDLKSCKEGKDLLLFTLLANEDFKINDKMKSEIESLKQIVYQNRKRVKRVIKKWTKGYKEKINIYITPVSGNFCSSNLAEKEESLIDYKGLVYIPIDNFSYNKSFFESSLYRQVLFSEYLKDDYNNSQ